MHATRYSMEKKKVATFSKASFSNAFAVSNEALFCLNVCLFEYTKDCFL